MSNKKSNVNRKRRYTSVNPKGFDYTTTNIYKIKYFRDLYNEYVKTGEINENKQKKLKIKSTSNKLVTSTEKSKLISRIKSPDTSTLFCTTVLETPINKESPILKLKTKTPNSLNLSLNVKPSNKFSNIPLATSTPYHKKNKTTKIIKPTIRPLSDGIKKNQKKRIYFGNKKRLAIIKQNNKANNNEKLNVKKTKISPSKTKESEIKKMVTENKSPVKPLSKTTRKLRNESFQSQKNMASPGKKREFLNLTKKSTSSPDKDLLWGFANDSCHELMKTPERKLRTNNICSIGNIFDSDSDDVQKSPPAKKIKQ